MVESRLGILNLEDSESDAELNQAMLAARWPACHLIRVDNRHDYVTALSENALDVILCCCTIPGFDGMKAPALARETRPRVPFLFDSGTIGEGTARRLRRSTMVGLIMCSSTG